MVKLYALSLFYKGENGTRLLCAAYDLQSFSFFQRSSVQQFIGFASKMIVERTQSMSRQSVKQDNYMCHTYVCADNLAGVLTADHEYPIRVAYTLLTKVLDDFRVTISPDRWTNSCEGNLNFLKLSTYLSQYQDPREADALTKIQCDLDETKISIQNTLEALLERGEKLDMLISKTEELSNQSKLFYQTARKTNSCCNFG